MKFKKNFYFIFLFLISTAVIISALLLVLLNLDAGFSGEGKNVILAFLGGILISLLCFEMLSKFGLFYDTVYYDECGIKIATRKKIYEYDWESLQYLQAGQARGGLVCWQIVMKSGEKHMLFPPRPMVFADYVKQFRPDIELRF